MSRFEFLRGREDALYDMCKQVEKYQGVDTDILMLKSRRALEQIVTKLGCQGHTLREKVDDINSKLNISREMKNRIIKFKNLCNESIHYEEGKTATIAADSVLAELVDICKWLVDAKIEKKVETVIESNIKLLQEKQRELEKAFKNNDMPAVARISDEIKDLSTSQSIDIKKIMTPNGFELENDLISNDTNKDIETAEQFELLFELAQQGDPDAQYELGDFYDLKSENEEDEGNEEYYLQKAFVWYERAAEQGHVEAQFMLSVFYSDGLLGEEDSQKGFEWCKRAAEQGHVQAQRELAYSYQEGMGIEKNIQKAFEWYKRAAEQGDGPAQLHVANYYEVGYGIEKDEQKAFEWYKKAEEQGYEKLQLI
ncbi:MAG: sel1 repeat family protein [Anaerovibrio sp.]|uniref:tetratricopeptide repeat protein n=1 Tax=Anaerovibrio sp. TaxID=1872532 RepID=UPI0025FBDCE6|nr:tetratricopeptide repeat protein [Anaerovibrio sp.]MCR5175651.1 sel1 repeat family protein [Anaerovibrio sp.]